MKSRVVSIRDIRGLPPCSRALLCLLALCLVSVSISAAQPDQVITNFGQFFSLSPERAARHLPLKIRGTVLCYDPGWTQLYIHDGTESSYIASPNFPTNLVQGQLVELSGETLVAQDAPGWTNLNLGVIGNKPLPAAKPLRLADLGREFGQWIETTGQVRVVEASRGRLGLVLQDSGINCQVYILGLRDIDKARQWTGSWLRIRGINSSKISQGQLQAGLIFVHNLSDTAVLDRSAADSFEVPVIAIEALLDRELGGWTNQPVHINGLVSAYSPGDYIVVRDPTGIIRARLAQLTTAAIDQRVNLWGFLRVSPNESFLSDAFFDLGQPAQSDTRTATPDSPNVSTSLAPLVEISQVSKLDRVEAARHWPVRLHGVVTCADLAWQSGFIQNSKDAIYFVLTQPEVRPGQWVELTGHTDPGGFAPLITQTQVRVLGQTNIPPATRVDLDDLAYGHLDSHWIEMEGVVRRVDEDGAHLLLNLMSAKGDFKVVISELPSPTLRASLIDSLVRVKGACGSDINDRHQLTGFTVHVPSLDEFKVIEPSPRDPFSIPATSTRAVARFDPVSPIGRRLKVSGTVTLVLPGYGFFLQDDLGGIHVRSAQTNQVQQGDLVDALGFAALGEFAPRLEEAIFRVRGTAPLPPAKNVSAEQILVEGTNDSIRVQIEAQLLQPIPRSAHPKLILQSGPIIFTGRLMGLSSSTQLSDLRPGSSLRVTGICSLQPGERHQAEAFRLLIARDADVQLLRGPPVWRERNVLLVIGGMAVVILAGLGWVASLRRQVRRQTAAVYKERNLLATLLDHLPDNVYVKDLEGRYVLSNRAHARFHGASSPEYFRGKSLAQLFPPETAKFYAEADAQVLSGQTDHLLREEEVKNGAGQLRLLATTKVPLRDETGQIRGLVGFSRDITEAKRAEEELREKERTLSALMSNLPGLAYRCRNDEYWTMEFLSEGCLELTGYGPAELLQNSRKSYAQIIHPEDRDRVWQEVQTALQQRQKYRLLYRIVSKQGTEKWVWEQGLGIFSKAGQVEACEGFVIDVTERRRAEEAVRISEERFRAVWEHSIDGMRLTDHEGKIIAVNQAFCHLVKMPREKLVGQFLGVAYSGPGPEGDLEAYVQHFRAGTVVPRTTARVKFWNGEHKDMELSSCFVEVGSQGNTILCILRDISERRRVESVLAYERDLLTTLFENLPDALYFKDLQSRFVRVSKSKLESSWAMAVANHRFYHKNEKSPAQDSAAPTPAEDLPAHLVSPEAFAEFIVGKSDFDFFDESRARGAFEDEQEIIRTGNPLIGKIEKTNHLNGRVTWSLSTKMPWFDKDGRLIGTFGVSKDITSIKEAEASVQNAHKQLVDASRQAGMAEVATGVLHNVGNVLNSVNVSVTLLAEKLRQSRVSSLAKAAALLREHSSRLGDFMVNDSRGRQLPLFLEQLSERLASEQASLLQEVACLAQNVDHIKNIVAMQQSYARPAGITESVQPVDLVEDALRINSGALARHQIQILREYQPQLPALVIDKHKALQILVNLISNAGHACSQSVRSDKCLTVRLSNGGQRLRIAVSDNGVGIAPENLTRIFNLGFTTRPDGHGFGLHSGALAARELGGALSSHSDGPGHGATFVLELPLSPTPNDCGFAG